MNSSRKSQKSSCNQSNGRKSNFSGLPTQLNHSQCETNPRSNASQTRNHSLDTMALSSTSSSRGSVLFNGLSESCPLSRRQASILSKKRAAEELELARQQELRAECQAEAVKKAKKDQPAPTWSELDKDIFFQGVLACGRDFDKLHKFCTAKSKLKDTSERTKDQIRHFYYRTVKNLQSVVNMERVSKNKEANELFAMINWAEFRRKIGGKLSLLAKHSERLKQLIYTGETRFKHRGKMIKIKTPLCDPLNKLFEKAKEDAVTSSCHSDRKKSVANSTVKAKVPDFIIIELQPKTNAAWQRINDISHNPHLRLKVKCDQTLSTVIQTLEKKWAPHNTRLQQDLKLSEEWEKLPYIRLYPSPNARLQPFDITLVSNNSPTTISFNEYLDINKEDVSEKKTGTDNSGDPVKFLKDKLEGINSQLKTDGSNSAAVESTSDNHDTKSHEWINLATHGWTSSNSKDLSLGCLHLLFGSPDKVLMEYEWPDLERADEVVHIFAGMINRLISIAENEFCNPSAKKKQQSTQGSLNSSTNRSPSTRGKRGSNPINSSKPVTIAPAPSQDPEFKKPGVPLQTENRQLADAIALGRQELRPHARKVTSRQILVQRSILPTARAIAPYNTPIHLKTSMHNGQSSITTMDVSCIRGNITGTKLPTAGKTSTTTVTSTPTVHAPRVQSLLSSQSDVPTSNSTLSACLSQLISSTSSTSTDSHKTVPNTPTVINENSQDILAQAISSIQTPVKRRITPTLVSHEACNNSLFELSNSSQLKPMNSESLSEHSLSSLLNNIASVPNTNSGHDVEDLLNSNSLENREKLSTINSFEGLLSGNKSSEASESTSSVKQSTNSQEHDAPDVKDAWLTPDIALTDFSLSSLLGDKSPKRNASTQSTVVSEQPLSGLSDDSRMSFLTKLDVNELGVVLNLY